jgi:molybdate transport system ATP-binding protein
MFFEITLCHRIGDRDLVLDLASDEPLTAIVGVSGAGKTTILNCVAGLIRPDGGRIAIAGETLFDSAVGVDVPPERRRAGYVFQDARLFPHMKVAANLAYGEKLARGEDKWISRDRVIDLLGIGHLLARYPANLSGGETRRVAIGRALLSAPRFLLLDEPMASLDAERAEIMRQLVEQIRDELSLPTLLVSHDKVEVERLAGRVVSLD